MRRVATRHRWHLTGRVVRQPARRYRLLWSVRDRCRYTLPGLWVALLFAALSFTPSLPSRPPAYQALVAGVDGAIGYGLGVVGAWGWREYADRDAHRSSPRARRLCPVGVAGQELARAHVLTRGRERGAADSITTGRGPRLSTFCPVRGGSRVPLGAGPRVRG